MMENDVIDVDLCVNDGNGNHTGYCEQATFRWMESGELTPMLELELYPIPVEPHYQEHYIKVDEEIYPIEHYGTMVGNVFWDMVRLQPEQATRLINQMLQWGANVSAGFTLIFDKAKAGPLVAQDLYDVMPF